MCFGCSKNRLIETGFFEYPQCMLRLRKDISIECQCITDINKQAEEEIFVCFNSYVPVDNFLFMSEWVYLG